ncbi:DUF3883 domain-containing protein [Paenibacillus sacheonensis]|uniref:DUF3883 domain-containing protein n=1 Tax=Paenibacillus sacheonensis TaxID=742054 RepID=A0A7X4YUP4_9BACL|nr:DUF3883 domain-containing protein [Paenibacillus sacheonensis]MBM7568090.1 hypothetical protein [Paenibacillus sacheonensis]NBC72882.1 DUF3883 domain-containing protein [Paenibacillus sacheonensis]
MEPNHKLALIISYYLSKYDRKSLTNLGYKNFTEAFQEIGTRLAVKPNTIKNMRENFDPLHPNNRVGWYQRELSPSRIGVVEKYGALSEAALTAVVKDILGKYTVEHDKFNNELVAYTKVIEDDSDEKESNSRTFTTRGLTGLRAEEIFLDLFQSGQINNLSGELIDKRHDGCGYDFEMRDEPNYRFEIKGLLSNDGGISLTDKEWNIASELRQKYVLVLIRNINESPFVTLFNDPFNSLRPTKRVYTTIAVNWSIESSQLVDSPTNYRITEDHG